MPSIEQQKKSALHIVRELQAAGFQALFAGGCVRDHLLGRTPSDYDVATDARPEQVEALFPRTLPLGKAFGVIAVIERGEVVEVATFRKDAGPSDGRRPHQVTFCAAKEDALRRDFTINGMFFDPLKEKLIDYVHGRRDLELGVVRAIGEPARRFQEDHLRMLRAVRFTHNLEFDLEPETESAIRGMAGLINDISAERIEQELTRILTRSPRPGGALRHLLSLGILREILPELPPMAGLEQPPQYHPEGDVFEHTVLMLDLMGIPEETDAYTRRELAYAVLLHDVGKPPTARKSVEPDGSVRVRFNGHAAKGAEIADRILVRLKFPNKARKRIVAAIHNHMRFMEVQNMRSSTLRKWIASDSFELEMELHRLDCLGSHGKLDNYEFVRAFQRKMADEPVLPEPWIRGDDLLKLGVPPGKALGRILRTAYDDQMEGRFPSKGALLEHLKTTLEGASPDSASD